MINGVLHKYVIDLIGNRDVTTTGGHERKINVPRGFVADLPRYSRP
jgi:hypothetical protein